MRPAKKKALLIGINYVGQAAELSGCVNDVVDARAMCAALGYGEVCVLFDGRWAGAPDPADERVGGSRPTRALMTAAFKWLVGGAGPGDRLYLHYSGHGGQLRERVPGSEESGMDDTLVPVDYETAGMVRDDELHDLLIKPLRGSGAALRVVLDCCHSGTGLDLRHNLSLAGPHWWRRGAPGGTEGPSAEGQAAPLIARLTADLVRAELATWYGRALVEKHLGDAEEPSLFREWTAEGSSLVPDATILCRRAAEVRADAVNVLAVSGCADRQTSADAEFSQRAGGALSHYLFEALRPAIAAHGSGSAVWPAAADLLRGLRRHMRAGGYTQTPQVSSEAPFTAATRFDLA